MAVLSLLTPLALAAQEPEPADTAVAPAPDPNAPHSEPDSVRLPVVPPSIVEGPLPIGTRIVFTRDSLSWSGAETLADLLARVPGVYIARGGTWGQPEVVQYAGRGPRGIEIYWDGFNVQPMGRDSLYTDVTQVPLTFAERVEVVVLPGSLRIDVVTRRQRVRQTQSSVQVLSGKFNRTQYSGIFQHRYASGLALSFGFHWKNTDGATDAGNFRDVALWVKSEWIPSERFGATYQFLRVKQDRDGGQLPAGIEVVGRNLTHRQDRLSVFLDQRHDGIGWRFDGTVGSATFSGDSGVAKQTLSQVAATATYRRPRWSGWLGLRSFSDRISLWAEGGIDASLTNFLTVSIRGDRAEFDGDRSGTRLRGAASLELPGGLWVRGAAAVSDWPQVAALSSETPIRTNDWSGHIGWRVGGHELEVGVVRRDAFRPLATPEFTSIAQHAPSPTSDYVQVRGRITPLPGITLGGWYEDPLTGGADFAPPRHTRLALTLRSKYWSTFRSGAFEIEIEANVDSWSTGIAGVDDAGAPIILPSATFVGSAVQIQLLGFQIFWYVQNFLLTDATYVPGYPIGRGNQVFGARWTFAD